MVYTTEYLNHWRCDMTLKNYSRIVTLFLAAVLIGLSCQWVTGIQGGAATQAVPTQKVSITPEKEKTSKFSLAGQIGGVSYAVDAQGNYAYLGVGPRLYVLDISNASAPKLTGQTPVMPGVVRNVIAAGQYAYVATGKGYVRVIDIADPAKPVEMASFVENSYAQGLALDGNYLYIADNAFGLRVVDISDPLHPKKVGEVKTPGAFSSVTIYGKRAYLAGSTYGQGLVVIDVSNPANPVQTSSISISDSQGSVIYSVKVSGNYAYIAAGNPGLIIIDISDPAKPVEAGSFDTSWADGLALVGNDLYLTDQVDGLYVLDISNPKKPAQKGLVPVELFGQTVPGERSLTAESGQVFIANYNQGLLVIDASGPAIAARFDTPLPGAVMDVLVENNIAHVIADTLGLYTLDVSNPAQPRQLSFDISRIQHGMRTPRGVARQGNFVYVVDINNGFSVYDVSDPSLLIELSRVEKPQGMTDVAVAGNYAYVTVQEHEKRENRGMLVFDISNPSKPKQVGFVKTEYSLQAIAVQGNYAYLPEYTEIMEIGQSTSLRSCDVSSPSNPVLVGELDTTAVASMATSIAVAGNHTYIGDLNKGLTVIDISNPTRPAQVGVLAQASIIQDLVVVDDKVFTANYGWVSVIDVSDPTNPTLEAVYSNPGMAMGIHAVKNMVYVADFDAGLVILKYEK